jgi:hypothetical protein
VLFAVKLGNSRDQIEEWIADDEAQLKRCHGSTPQD